MYKINKGLLEWTLDIKTFIPEFNRKCKIFDNKSESVKFYSQQDNS